MDLPNEALTDILENVTRRQLRLLSTISPHFHALTHQIEENRVKRFKRNYPNRVVPRLESAIDFNNILNEAVYLVPDDLKERTERQKTIISGIYNHIFNRIEKHWAGKEMSRILRRRMIDGFKPFCRELRDMIPPSPERNDWMARATQRWVLALATAKEEGKKWRSFSR